MNSTKRIAAWVTAAFLLLVAEMHLARAADGNIEERLAKLEQRVAASTNSNSGDNAWVLASSALVLMMTAPGLILFYGGLVRRKNVLGTMMHSFLMMGLITVIWALFGYRLAFGEGSSIIGSFQ